MATGFPENRSVLYKKVPDNDQVGDDVGIENAPELDSEGDEETEKVVQDTELELVQLEGKQGKYKEAPNIIDRYMARPECLDKMCLAQFCHQLYSCIKDSKRC